MSDLFNFLIVGCGYVGSELARGLVQDGHRVFALRRNPPDGNGKDGIEWRRGDLADPDSLRSAVPLDLDGIFYTAAVSRARGDDPELVYHQGLANLLAVLAEQGQTLRRLVFTSSTGVYGQTDGAWVNEDSPVRPALPAGQAMAAGEALLRACPFETVAVRYSGIYGPERIRMLRMIQGDRPILAARDHIWLNQIHRDDCVGALRHVWNLANPDSVYIASDHAPATRFEVLSWLANACGVPGPLIDAEMAVPPRLRGNKRVDGSRLRASGYRFVHRSFREGYATLLPNADVGSRPAE